MAVVETTVVLLVAIVLIGSIQGALIVTFPKRIATQKFYNILTLVNKLLQTLVANSETINAKTKEKRVLLIKFL